MRSAFLVLAMGLPAAGHVVAAESVDARAARDLAASCAACHGTEGRSVGTFAALAGQDRAQLVASLTAFRDGTRAASVMHQHAKGYSDAEFELLADFFSKQPASAGR